MCGNVGEAIRYNCLDRSFLFWSADGYKPMKTKEQQSDIVHILTAIMI